MKVYNSEIVFCCFAKKNAFNQYFHALRVVLFKVSCFPSIALHTAATQKLMWNKNNFLSAGDLLYTSGFR